MVRLSALLIAICMVVVAASLGLVLYLTFGLTGAEASVVALSTLTAFSVYNAVASRMRYQSELGAQLGDLSRGTADLARQVGEQGRRLATLEKNSDTNMQKAFAATQPLQAEISELGLMLRQVVETVAAQDATIGRLHAGGVAPVEAAAPAGVAMPEAIPDRPAEPSKSSGPLRLNDMIADGPFRGMTGAAVVSAIREAIGANRIEVYLQPVVSLPQRKVRHYEALMRMRLADNVIAAADFIPYAEAGSLMASLDYLMVARCVRVLRRLQEKTKDVGVFCNIASVTLSDREVMAQILDFAQANRVLAPVLTFELPYPAIRGMGARENESLARLTDLGFRLSVDHVADLRFDARELADRKCAFMKISASVLLGKTAQAMANIHPADIAGLLSRNGIELIAEKIENEATVVDLLDFDLKFGQGNLFSPPRAMKQDASNSVAEAPASAVEHPAPAPVMPAPVISAPAPPVTIAPLVADTPPLPPASAELPAVEPPLHTEAVVNPLPQSQPQSLPVADFNAAPQAQFEPNMAEGAPEPQFVESSPVIPPLSQMAAERAAPPERAVERAAVPERAAPAEQRTTIDRNSALARLARIVARP